MMPRAWRFVINYPDRHSDLQFVSSRDEKGLVARAEHMDPFVERRHRPSANGHQREASLAVPSDSAQPPVSAAGAPARKPDMRQSPSLGTQKVAVAAEPNDRKRAKRDSGVKPSALAKTFAADDVFIEQSLELEDELYLRCRACNKQVSCEKITRVNQHCFGVGHSAESFAALPEDLRLAKRHFANLVRLREDEHKQALIATLCDEYRAEMFEKHGAHVVGSTLPVENVTDRAQVLLSLWRAGVPVAKLDNPDFVRLIEDRHDALGGREGVRRMIPVAVRALQQQVTDAVAGRMLSIFFDGAMINEMVECVIVRFLTDVFAIRHLCIGVAMLSKSMTAATLKDALRMHLTEARVEDCQIVAATSDSAAVNSCMVDLWNDSASALYGLEFDARRLFWLGCLSHALSNCGTAMRKEAAVLKLFFSSFKKMANTSTAARAVFQHVTGAACPLICDNRWFHWFDCAVRVYDKWAQMPYFLDQLMASGFASKSAHKMHTICRGSGQKWIVLEMEIRAVIGFGKLFRDFCALLEGDGFVLPYVAECLRKLRNLTVGVLTQKHKHVLFVELAQSCRDRGISQQMIDGIIANLVPIIKTGMDKFCASVWEKLPADRFELFDAAAIFHPLLFLVKVEELHWATSLIRHCARLSDVKGVPRNPIDFRLKLVAEVETYKTEAQKFRAVIIAKPELDTPTRVWEWWCEIRLKVPAWFEIAQILVLIQPSSAIAERFYSVVKSQTSEQQNAEYSDTFAGRTMALFNK